MIATYLAFYFWFTATVGILLGMDVMEPGLFCLSIGASRVVRGGSWDGAVRVLGVLGVLV